MRLFDTYTKALVELPPPPGPVRMYFCGPTVYARAHIGNARPFVIGMWLRSWLRATGYEVKFVHNITDVNDKIYDAAPGASAALAEQATAWYLEDTGGLGLGHARRAAEGDRVHPGDRLLHRAARRARVRLPGRGRRLLPRRELPRVRAALRPAPGSGRGAGAERAQGGPARLRALEGEQAGRGHALAFAVGRGPAGLAHRVLGDGGGAARARVRDPRRRPRPRLPASRERGRAVARARPSVRGDLGAQRAAPAHRRQDVEVEREHRDDPGGARASGGARRRSCSSSAATGASRSTSPTRR